MPHMLNCCENSPSPCCQPSIPLKRSAILTKKLEVLSAVALSVFAAYCNWPLFLLSSTLGASYQVIKIACKVDSEKEGNQRPGCGQGFGELISQLKLLSPEVILATSYVAWRHLRHDPEGFVPFIGFFVGMGIVHNVATYFLKKQTAGAIV